MVEILQPVRAFAFAATLQPRVVEGLLSGDTTRVKLTKTIAVERLAQLRATCGIIRIGHEIGRRDLAGLGAHQTFSISP